MLQLCRESVVKHLGTSMLATEVAWTATVRERVREVVRQQSAVAAFRAGATPVRQREGHGTTPPPLLELRSALGSTTISTLPESLPRAMDLIASSTVV